MNKDTNSNRLTVDVSVIIPAYNAAPTIAQTIESLLAQSYPNWEAIVVDDGSTDATAPLVRQFSQRDSRIRLVSQPNAGESGARNTGIAHARFDWLLFLDADDWIAPAHLERLTAQLSADPALDAVHCAYVRVALDGTSVSDEYQAPAGDLFPTLARRAAFAVHACIVRRSLVETVGKFDTSLKKSADWDLWQRIARTGARFGAVSEVLAYYRMLPDSSSTEAEQLFTDGLVVLERGHSADPRVPNPHPDYVNGLQQEVDSQKFYLLCWCAGLLLGKRRDAIPLLRNLAGIHCRELYPDAIAKCLFDAATLPTGQPRQVWETLWPDLDEVVASFLAALEEQSQTPDLACKALIELKLLVLKHSPVWSAAVEEQARTIAHQRALLEQQAHATSRLEADRDHWRQLAQQREQEREASAKDLEESVRLTAELREDNARLQADLDQSHQLKQNLQQDVTHLEAALDQSQGLNQNLHQDIARLQARVDALQSLNQKLQQVNTLLESDLDHIRSLNQKSQHDNALLEFALDHAQRLQAERDRIITALESTAWVRLGRRLRVLKNAPAPSTPDTSGEPAFYSDEEDPRENKWQLRVADGNIADLLFPADDPERVRIAITKARTRTRWDIQLNQPWFRVRAGDRYCLNFRARADKRRGITVGFAQAHEPWAGLGLYQTIELTPAWQTFQEEFTVLHDDDNARIHFDAGARKIAVEISDVVLKSLADGASLEPDPPPAEIAEPDRFVLKDGVIEFTAGRR